MYNLRQFFLGEKMDRGITPINDKTGFCNIEPVSQESVLDENTHFYCYETEKNCNFKIKSATYFLCKSKEKKLKYIYKDFKNYILNEL